MSVVKIPKKLKDICESIRNGDRGEALELLAKVDKFDVQKHAIYAELAYFAYELEKGIDHGKIVISNNDQWYAGNVYDEHLAAFVFSSIQIQKQDEAIEFLNGFLESKKSENLLPHQVRRYEISVTNLLRKVKGFWKDIKIKKTKS